jgi:hypothetical protein
MSRRRTRASDWKAVAEIRGLQSRAAEMDAVRAGNGRDEAAGRRESAEAALDEAQLGWIATVEGGVFDPLLTRHWFAEVGRRQAEESEAGEALRDADRRLEESLAAWHVARARADAATERRRDASAMASRRREETRLTAMEDRAALQGRRS